MANGGGCDTCAEREAAVDLPKIGRLTTGLQPETPDQTAAREYMACLRDELEAKAEWLRLTDEAQKAQRRWWDTSAATQRAHQAMIDVATSLVGQP